ncbi:MAG: type VII toxin-antitoxin system MntA family adenylyltransferase antitoxin [Candidatus Brocadiales bacterium]
MKTLKAKLVSFFKKEPGVIGVLIYGSYVKGKQTNTSDIDIAVLTKNKLTRKESTERRIQYSLSLSRLLQKNADVVLLRDAPLLLRFNILKEGKKVYVADKTMVTEFKARAVVEYLDFKPLEDFFFDNMIKKMEERLSGKRSRGKMD